MRKRIERLIKCSFFLLFMVAAFPFGLNAQITKVAVWGPSVKQGSEKVAVIELSIINSRFRDAVSGMSGIELISRTDVDNILNELKFQQSGMVSENDKKLLGQMKGVDIIVSLMVSKGFGYVNIEASFIDVEKANVVGRTQSELAIANNPPDLAEKSVELAKKLTGVTTSTSNSSSRPSFSGGGTGVDLTFSVGNASFKMIFVKGGSMYLGCTSGSGSCASDESPSHNVTLSDYYIGETEVTQALWKAVMGYNNNPSNWKGDQLPVEMVSWTDCDEFITRLNSLIADQLPQGYRFALPSEAQWEYAARGGQKSSGSMYAGSGNVGFVAWYDGNSSSRTHDVKQKAPNELGVYDMSGNVWEWCEDWYSSSWYSDNRNWTDPVNTYVGSYRVFRGGSWGGSASNCRVAVRLSYTPGSRSNRSGFRLAIVRR